MLMVDYPSLLKKPKSRSLANLSKLKNLKDLGRKDLYILESLRTMIVINRTYEIRGTIT